MQRDVYQVLGPEGFSRPVHHVLLGVYPVARVRVFLVPFGVELQHQGTQHNSVFPQRLLDVGQTVVQGPGAKIQITTETYPEEILVETETDGNGQTEEIELPAPPLEYSLEAGSEQPYAEYNIRISAPDFETKVINGAEILSGELALQNTALLPQEVSPNPTEELFVIPAHTLYGDYPPKIEESEVKDVNESGEIVLSRVVIPEYVVVHDGPPSDNSAKNYYVTYKDYISHKSNFPLIL